MDSKQVLRETILKLLYNIGLVWRLYAWYQRGGNARRLSMFLGQSIKLLRRGL